MRVLGAGAGGRPFAWGSISHVQGPMGGQKTAPYSGYPEFDSRSEEYRQADRETFVSVFIHHVLSSSHLIL